MSRKLLATGTCALAFVLGGIPAYAQTADDEGIGEIVVTAERRAQNLQDVPLTVQAVSAEELQLRNITNLLELQRMTPALTVQDTASNVSPFIRGVGSTVTGAGQSGSVATYVDGVYVATLASAAFDFDNVEQIQVLSGPQGALYGRNATGGAIVVTSYTPGVDDPFSLNARAQFGNFNGQAVSATVASGFNGQVAASLSASYKSHDGYIDNLNPAGFGSHQDDFNDRDAWSVQGALVFEPTDRLSIVLRASHFEAKDRFGVGLQAVGLDIPVAGTLNGSQAYYAGLLQQLGFPPADAAAAAGNLQFSNQFSGTYDTQANGFSRGILSGEFLPGSFTALETNSASLRVTYSFEGFDLTSLTSYTQAESWSATEIIFANPATYPAGFQPAPSAFRATSPPRTSSRNCSSPPPAARSSGSQASTTSSLKGTQTSPAICPRFPRARRSTRGRRRRSLSTAKPRSRSGAHSPAPSARATRTKNIRLLIGSCLRRRSISSASRTSAIRRSPTPTRPTPCACNIGATICCGTRASRLASRPAPSHR